MATELKKTILEMGFEQAEAYPELETNHAIQAEWKPFDSVQHKRRRVYKKVIGRKDGFAGA